MTSALRALSRLWISGTPGAILRSMVFLTRRTGLLVATGNRDWVLLDVEADAVASLLAG